MPGIGSIPINLPIKWGKAVNDEIDDLLHLVITNALAKAIFETQGLMRQIVPESAAAPGRYGPKYKSELLMETAITELQKQLLAVKRGGLRHNYIIPLIFPATYAKHMNEAEHITGNYPPKGWSKRGSGPRFLERSNQFLRDAFLKHLRVEITKQNIITSVSAYIG